MTMPNKPQINFILKIFFLLFTFIYVIKQEGEINKYTDYSDYSKKTYSEFVIDQNCNSDISFYKYFSVNTGYNHNIPASDVNYSVNQLTLKYSIHNFFDYFNDIAFILLPQTKILKILQKKNVCHKSSDDSPAQPIYC